jgi:hypothetical protein
MQAENALLGWALRSRSAPTDETGMVVPLGPTHRAQLSFELALQPEPGMVSIVRRFVEESFAKFGGDPESVFRVAMAAHELLENAAKYSTGETVQLEVQLDTSRDTVRTRVTNDTTPLHRARLRERVRLLQGAPKPFDLYQTLMRRSFQDGEESGLGLARICGEGDLALAMEDIGNTVTIVASSQPPRSTVHE